MRLTAALGCVSTVNSISSVFTARGCRFGEPPRRLPGDILTFGDALGDDTDGEVISCVLTCRVSRFGETPASCLYCDSEGVPALSLASKTATPSGPDLTKVALTLSGGESYSFCGVEEAPSFGDCATDAPERRRCGVCSLLVRRALGTLFRSCKQGKTGSQTDDTQGFARNAAHRGFWGRHAKFSEEIE